MAKQAVGIIETKGLVSLIEASDAALKSADITMLTWVCLPKRPKSPRRGCATQSIATS